MADIIIQYIRQTLPEELSGALEKHLETLENGDYKTLLESEHAKVLLGDIRGQDNTKDIQISDFPLWSDYVLCRLEAILGDRKSPPDSIEQSPAYQQHLYFVIGLAAFGAFLQGNVTGPPLDFTLLSSADEKAKSEVERTRRQLITSLSVDGEAAYRLTPNIELFCLAKTILSCPPIAQNVKSFPWARLRLDFWHQKLLSEPAPTLQKAIFERLDELENQLGTLPVNSVHELRVAFLLEKATIHTHHGLDKLAREDLELATKERGFEFALTGLLGKRTKWQQKDTSQLVVLARSLPSGSSTEMPANGTDATAATASKRPDNLDLNDDTLLESISFTKKPTSMTDIVSDESLPKALRDLDPEKQPLLDPFDSIILLALASSITNTSPADGLTREETLPYATRVLEGGSSNWQVYTQALLVRSRVEGYRSRTVERGLLQLQVLVDQVIAETTTGKSTDVKENTSSTFLPRAKESESAPVSERLKYVFQLSSPSRWELEAELASRWVSLGGLRSALEIYERLEMWAEAALCWAATEREDKAKMVVRRQLFHATSGDDESADLDTEKWEGKARSPPPSDAPRLYCIIGDIDKDPAMYQTAWEVSGSRYARAQRSLGKYYFAGRDFTKAAHAYAQSLKVNQINQSAWFAMGCALLELQEYVRAAEAFSRTVQIDDTDAEAWSNLAAALIHVEPDVTADGEDAANHSAQAALSDPQKHRRDALKAFKRASTLKFESHKIWANVLIVATSLVPPSYNDMVTAQGRIIEIRGKSVGEQCVDAPILEMLVRHVVALDQEEGGLGYDPNKPGLARMVVRLVDEKVIPLITSSAHLWKIVSKLALWRKRPTRALEAEEKAWRCVTSQPGWEFSEEKQWDAVVDATIDLVDAYQSLGEMDRTEGLGAGDGELVAKDWKFKARSAIRGIMGKGKDTWEGTDGWDRLKDSLADLKG
ncbi:hypothetical protein EJ05DRAFT_445966 [Pseudovirgaria hyperparasitica]|uniref:Uncharacterized protein n=1 Tax=Pseudovirgaria hyperparasitica TaxID=470096 RepID=A0A6A6VQK9_9PEZI|nr:uncharacterized protein EJ05DRAFT_445966 [Pseudovirgaria hyperparasitica]KAF2752892.1 hypothetical protein EJ05DRAFT_445966 [Pseudovirgaria hyperparasitica]